MNFQESVNEFDSSRLPDSNSTSQNDSKPADEKPEGIKTYTCKYAGCDKSFRYRSEINRHMVTHTNTRPYLCPYKDCRKGFKRSDALATHIRIHAKDKSYPCPVVYCQSVFASKAGLRYHISKHNNENANHNFNASAGLRDANFATQEASQFNGDAMIEESSQKQGVGQEIARTMSFTNIDPMEYLKGHHQLKDSEIEGQKYDYFEQPRGLGVPNYIPPYQQFSMLRMNMKSSTTENTESDMMMANSLTHALMNQSLNQEAFKAGQRQDPANMLRNLLSEYPEEKQNVVRMIRKILEENNALKKRLDDYQRVIRNYQGNVRIVHLNNAQMRSVDGETKWSASEDHALNQGGRHSIVN